MGKSKGCVQYYHCTPEGSHTGKYLPKKNIEFAKKLAQKTYDQRVQRCAEKRLGQLNRMLKDYEDHEIEACYLCEHPERQKLITPVQPTTQQRIDAWLAFPYKGKEFREGSPFIISNNGLRVRSKSEKIMADYFDSLGIRYKYECPLFFKSGGCVYPDFTFFSAKTGREIYWEHEGMMDNEEYARTAIKKIEKYVMNGILPGEQLILTFETSTSVINTQIMKKMTDLYILEK